MRYSFHGKIRATGQQVDGFVEAPTSTEAIDRLADQGIIGVYSVRAEPKLPKNAIILSGADGFDQSDDEEEAPQPQRQLPAPIPVAYAPAPVPVPVVQPIVTVPAVAAAMDAATATVMSTLVDKLSTLVGQVEKLLARPMQVVYSNGPARGGGGGGDGKKRASRATSDDQNSTLRDIFKSNMELRQSLAKLAGPSAPVIAPTASAATESADPDSLPMAPREPSLNGRHQAQPAA